jgi:haloalkane dehalogenase
MKDWCFSPHFLRRFQQLFPQAETLELPDAGHYLFEDAPENMLSRLRSFLQAHPLPVV